MKAYWLYLKGGGEWDQVGYKANRRSNGNGLTDSWVLCHPETLFHLLSCFTSFLDPQSTSLSWFLLSLCQSTVSFKYISTCLHILLYMIYIYVIYMIYVICSMRNTIFIPFTLENSCIFTHDRYRNLFDNYFPSKCCRSSLIQLLLRNPVPFLFST